MEKTNRRQRVKDLIILFSILGIAIFISVLMGNNLLGHNNSNSADRTRIFSNLDTIPFPGLGKIQYISSSEDTVFLHLCIVDDRDGIKFDIKKMADNKSVTKDYLKYGIEYIYFNDDFKTVVDYALSNNQWLMWDIEGVNTKHRACIGLSPTELHEAAFKNIYKSRNGNAQVKSEKAEVFYLTMTMKAESMILPIKINDAITWTEASIDKDNIIFTYTLDDVNYILDKKTLRQSFKGIIMKNIETMPYRLCSITNRGIRAVYKYKSGKDSFEEICSPKQIFDYEMKTIDTLYSDTKYDTYN